MTASPSDNDDPLLGNGLTGLLDCALDDGFNPTEPAVPEHWEPPTPAHIAVLLPQYQIEHLIGRGGMGAVYKGRQITLNRPVAIKVLPAELARNKEFVARFHREAQLLASLSHQGIVTIFDFGQTTEGHLYFVMEYVDGTDLNRLIHKQKKRLEPKEALSLTMQICEAMQYAHEKGVVHRDIKPANVLVTKDGRAKLADFGLAMKPAESEGDHQPPRPEVYFDGRHSPDVAAMRFTQPGAAMGTPDYAAPEVYEGKADERSDIYALGIMLYEMLTGAPPKGYFQLPSVMASVDHRVDQVVVKALEIDPGARYQKVEEMKADVQAATQPLAEKPPVTPESIVIPQAPPAASKIEIPEIPPSPPRKSMVSRLILLLVISAAGYALWTFTMHKQSRVVQGSSTATPPAPSRVQTQPAKTEVVKTPSSSTSSAPTASSTATTKVVEPQPSLPPEPVGLYLGDMTPLSSSIGWGSLQTSYYDTDRNVAREALLDGQPCKQLLFTHAPSRVKYAIPGGYNRFKAIGFGPTPIRLPPSMDFSSRKSWKYIVELDGIPVFESSELIRYPKGQVSIDVRIPEGTKTITLVTDGLGDTNSDHSMWAYPRLYQEPVEKPVAPKPPPPPDATTLALDALEKQFRTATEQEAKQILASKLATLNKSYAVNGLPNAIAAAWKRQSRDDVAAVEKERSRFGTALSVPPADPAGTNGVVAQLHDTYRKALKGYEAEAAAHAASTSLYESYLFELNKLAGTASDPARVRARAQEVAAKGGFRIPFISKAQPAWRQRCIDSERMAATLANGGSKETEGSISRALFYLKGRQNADGSWGTTEKAGRTALALLACLGHCETLESSSYGDTTMKALLYLIETAKKNPEGIITTDIGSPHAAVEHAMATTALAELYEQARLGARSLPGMRETLEKAASAIVKHQRLDGGWAGVDRGQGYRPSDQGSSAIFATAWQVQALAVIKRSGLKIPNLQIALNRSAAFIQSKQANDGGFGMARSKPGTDSILLTGAGMNSLQLTRADAAALKKASGFTTNMLLNASFQWSTADVHGWLFYTQAFVTRGGSNWKAWNEKLLPLLLGNQKPDGSWARGSVLFGGNDTDATALGALIMESYYRIPVSRS